MRDTLNYVVIIPAFNADKTIQCLIDQIIAIMDIPVIIIDDGSNFPVKNIITHPSCTVHRIDNNIGKGNALQIGFALANTAGYTHAITLDADLQHPVKHLPEFMEIDKTVDLVVGTRQFDKSMPLHRRLSNYLTSFIVSKICGSTFSDSQCGYRRYKLGSISDLTFQEMGFVFESEIIIKMFKNNLAQHVEIPIETVYNNEKSHISNVGDTIKFIQLIIKSMFK